MIAHHDGSVAGRLSKWCMLLLLLMPSAQSKSAVYLTALEIDSLKGQQVAWNAAAVNTAQYGWVAMATITRCFWGDCGWSPGPDPQWRPTEMLEGPWISQLGSENAPNLSRFREGRQFGFDAESFARISEADESNMLNLDYR
jgi:hypothetical protein